MKKLIVCGLACLLLTACGGTASRNGPTPPAPGVKLGAPYNVGGETYYPSYDPHYDQTGIASWYGPGFHGGHTANGEKFDQYEFTAAHPTLPLPCLVRVTNTENGSTIIVRINDRGPFKKGRIIDLSRNAAKALGIDGTAHVRVQYLAKESEQYWARRHLKTEDIHFASNDPNAPTNREESVPEEVAGSANVSPEAGGQVHTSAPVMAVNTGDLQPENMKIRPIQPRFQVVDDANAADAPSHAATAHASIGSSDLPAPDAGQPSPGGHMLSDVKPKVVQLSGDDNRSDEADAPDAQAPPSAKSMPFHVGPSVPAPESRQVSGSGVQAVGWYIQAGSFASEQNAHALAGRLKAVGQTETADVQAGGKTWHRVRVGPFDSRQAAQDALPQAKQDGASGAWVVRE